MPPRTAFFRSPFVRKEPNAVEGGHREEALKEIAKTVAIPRVERMDGQTATSFLLLLFFCGKRKVNHMSLYSRLYAIPSADNTYRQIHHAATRTIKFLPIFTRN
jgi:hypothetical protein